MRKPLIGAIVAFVLVAGGIGAYLGLRGGTSGRLAVELPPPNIVFILTDDQRWDTLGYMPIAQRLLVAHGATFTNSFVDVPTCCPSRASTLTGAYPQRTGVWQNRGPYGGFQSFHHDRSTMATWLHAKGYETALFGKYLNGYGETTYVPPGWNHWVAFDSGPRTGSYYGYVLNIDGELRRFGTRSVDYSTDVLADRVVSFIRGAHEPMMVYFAPAAPHPPATPAPADVDRFRNLQPYRPPSYNEQDVSDKPSWARHLARLSPARQAKIDLLREDMIASLQAVDRAVGRIVEAIAQRNALEDTIFVLTSDNGFSWGEHRWANKYLPWEEDIRVPLVIRYDRLTGTRRRDAHLVSNVDVAPTFADLAHTVPASPVDGKSLLPLLERRGVSWRSDLLVESLATRFGVTVPAYCILQTMRYVFVAYSSSETELYDLEVDPFELRNQASAPAFTSLIGGFERRLREVCSPRPPFTPPDFPP